MGLEGWQVVGPILWVGAGIATWVAAVRSIRHRRWLVMGRWATAVLFLIAGAGYNLASLVTGADYGGFADLAHFAWVTDAWQAVVAPSQWLFIGLLIAFEAVVGVLAVVGRRATVMAYVAVIGFYTALMLFGWFTTVWAVVMLPPMVMLLRAELRDEPATSPVEGRRVTVPT
jgi:hypothetical protein